LGGVNAESPEGNGIRKIREQGNESPLIWGKEGSQFNWGFFSEQRGVKEGDWDLLEGLKIAGRGARQREMQKKNREVLKKQSKKMNEGVPKGGRFPKAGEKKKKGLVIWGRDGKGKDSLDDTFLGEGRVHN